MVIGKKYKVHPSNGIVIRYHGVMDIDSLYKSTRAWFSANRYDYFEKENTEKNRPEGNILIIKMDCFREVDDYVRFRIEVDFEDILRVKKLEKGYIGEARIIIRAFMDFDYRDNWKLLPFLFYIYNNLIIKKKILTFYWPKIYNEMMDLNSLIKSKLDLVKK